jgi:hypothetical protein
VIALFLDNDISVQLAVSLSAEGHDVVTARQAGRAAASDAEHLLRASNDGRTLVTHNQDDFELLHDAWIRWSFDWGVDAHHASILVIPQARHVPVARMATDLARFFQSGVTLTNALYRRRIGGERTDWERWRAGDGWARR